MAKNAPRAKKQIGKAPKLAQLARLIALTKSAESVVVANISAMKVGDLTKLRADMRKQGARLVIAKNRLIKRALVETGNPAIDPLLKGPTAIAFGIGDPSFPAKALLDAAKDNEKIIIKGGIMEGAVLDPAGVKSLSVMPGRTALLSRVVGSLSAPPQKMVFALNQAVSKIVYALDAYRRKLEESGPAA